MNIKGQLSWVSTIMFKEINMDSGSKTLNSDGLIKDSIHHRKQMNTREQQKYEAMKKL